MFFYGLWFKKVFLEHVLKMLFLKVFQKSKFHIKYQKSFLLKKNQTIKYI